MKKIRMILILAAIMATPFSFVHSPHGMVLSAQIAQAEDAQFEDKLSSIEDRMHMMKMVIKRLRKAFIKAKENHQFMIEHGMPAKDIERLEKAFKEKMSHMINQAIEEINAI